MPAQLQFFDMEANLPATQSVQQPAPVTVGTSWQPNDIRVFYQLWFQPIWDYYYTTSSYVEVLLDTEGYVTPACSYPTQEVPLAISGPNALMEPPGYNTLGNILPTDNNQELGYSVSWRRLVAGDEDTFVAYALPEAMSVFATISFTVRGVDPTWVPGTPGKVKGADWGFLSFPSTTAVNVASSVTVPGAGTMVFLATSYPAPALASNAPTWATAQNTGFSIDAPADWTNLVATSSSGTTFYPYYANSSAIAIAKSYTTATSTGSVSFIAGPSSNPEMDGLYIWFKPGADVVAVTGNVTTTNTVTAATYSSSTLSANTAGSVTTTNTATTCFNPRFGYWISDPFSLSGAPVTGSIVRWNAKTPAASTVTVQTSINNGTTWDDATNNEAVPRLVEGDTTTQSVLAKISLTRVNLPTLYPSSTFFPGPTSFPAGSPPSVSQFELDVSTDASVDELVPIGYGMIDKVTVHATAGTTGSGSSTNVVGSTGVISRGGGQTGGGTSIKIHVNDMSYAIKRNVWQEPFTLPGGMLYSDAIKAMVLNRLPSQTAFNISTTTRICPLLVYGAQQGGDPWQDIMELAQAIGFEVFFDATGTFVCRPVPDPSLGEPVWQFDEEQIQYVSEVERELSSEQTFNDIVVVGQSTSTANPFSAEAYDDNPSSPTYVLGPYGRVTQRLTFSLITSQDQAQDAANTTLLNSIGGADTVTLTVVPMAALECGDIVKINCSNVKVNGTYMINSMTTPMSPADPQVLTCFRQSTNLS
jgi:Putative phage tail protein